MNEAWAVVIGALVGASVGFLSNVFSLWQTNRQTREDRHIRVDRGYQEGWRWGNDCGASCARSSNRRNNHRQGLIRRFVVTHWRAGQHLDFRPFLLLVTPELPKSSFSIWRTQKSMLRKSLTAGLKNSSTVNPACRIMALSIPVRSSLWLGTVTRPGGLSRRMVI
jgi:hypothetical protein